MKKIKFFALASITITLAVVIGILGVNAEDLITSEEEFLTCVSLTSVDTEEELVVSCKLGSDVELTNEVDIEENVTLDLNGYSINPSENYPASVLLNVIHGGTLTINDTKGTGTNSNAVAAIMMTRKTKLNESLPATLIINNGTVEGYWYGILGNGSTGRGNTKVVLNGGTVRGLKETDNTGIFNPQNGVVEITGGTVSGTTGIEMRAGSLKVTGGNIIGDHTSVTSKSNGSGSTKIGAGIAIAQHTTNHSIDVTITGGTIKRYAALYESDSENIVDNNSNNITIDIKGGLFETMNDSRQLIYSEDETAFISGGTFSNDVKNYVTNGYTSKLIGETYTVGIEHSINVSEISNGTVELDKTKAMYGEIVTINVTPDEEYELVSIKALDTENNIIPVTDGKFTMPTSDVTVTVELKQIKYAITVSEVTNGQVSLNKELAPKGELIEITNNTFIMPKGGATVIVTFKQIKYTVNVGKLSNGKVSVDKTEAVKGEIVTITAIIPEEGYELSSVKVLDKDNKEVTLTSDTFVMPSGNVTVSVELSKISYTTEVKPINPTEEVEVEIAKIDEEEIEEEVVEAIQ